jgi:GntR family transcriptional regulator
VRESPMVETLSGTRAQREPKYWALKQHLLDLLESLPAGSAIPTERALATDFGVSRTTAQRLELSSYTEDIRAQGREPSSKVLEVDEIYAEGELPKLLGIRTGAKVLRLRRLRLADGEPMAVETTHLPSSRFRGLRRQVESGGSLYEALRDRYGVELDHAEETIETSLAGPQEADLLGAEIGMPVLLLSRQTFASDGKPVEYVRSIYRGDRYKFVTTLNRP